MKRIVKKPEVRREEILIAAEKLFEKEGYAKTSVEAIIKEVGIAKGTFYYYFKSKQEIVSAIVELIANEVENYFASIVEQNNVTAIDKLKLMISGERKQEKIKPLMMKIIHKPENREIQERLNIQTIERISPLMKKVFEEGYTQGTFKKNLSLESVQILLAGSQFVLSSGLFSWSEDKISDLLKAMQVMLESMVEAKPGAFDFINTVSV